MYFLVLLKSYKDLIIHSYHPSSSSLTSFMINSVVVLATGPDFLV